MAKLVPVLHVTLAPCDIFTVRTCRSKGHLHQCAYLLMQVGFAASFASKLGDTTSSEIGKVWLCDGVGATTVLEGSPHGIWGRKA